MKHNKDLQHTEKELERAAAKHFPYTGSDAVEERTEQLRQERIADEKTVIEELRKERYFKSREDDQA